MIRFIRNIPWKDILVIVLLGALAIGAVVGISSAVTNKTKTVSSLKFERGAIDSTGAFTESDTSIYTADYIECQGLRIEPDFDATGTYQVFYYDINKQFMGATDVMKTVEKPVYDKGNTFALAIYCRIIITPETPKDSDGLLVDDYKIKFYEPAGIAGKFNITVNKDQSINYKKLLEGRTNYANVLGEGRFDLDNTFLAEKTGFYCFDNIDVSGASHIVLKVATSTLSNKVHYAVDDYTFPIIYEGDNLISFGSSYDNVIQYQILESNSEITYIAYNVSAYDDIYGCVDVDSVDILEIYVMK